MSEPTPPPDEGDQLGYLPQELAEPESIAPEPHPTRFLREGKNPPRGRSTAGLWVLAGLVVAAGTVATTELLDITQLRRQIPVWVEVLLRSRPAAKSPREGQGFAVDSGDPRSEFSTLMDAIERAEAGDTIEVAEHLVELSAPISIEDKPLTIRAAKGYSPLLVARFDTKPLIETNATLVLEGLAFNRLPGSFEPIDHSSHADVIEPSIDGPTLVACRGDALFATNCEFKIADDSGANCVALLGTRKARLRNCLVASGPGRAIAWEPARDGELELENTICTGLELIAAECGYGGTARLALMDCLFRGGSALRLGKTIAFDELALDVLARNCVFDVTIVLLHKPIVEQLGNRVHWLDQDQTLYARGARLTADGLGERANIVRSDIEEWIELWKMDEYSNQIGSVNYVNELTNRLSDSLPAAELKLYDAARGPDVDLIGPGEAWRVWRATDEYDKWRRDADAAIGGP